MKAPQNYNFILFLSFDFDGESAEVMRKEDPITISRGRYGSRVGIHKVISVLERYNIRTTFFTPGWIVEHYPEIIKTLVRKGHEIALHGYLHERLDKIERLEDEEHIFKLGENAILRITGTKPLGFRAPYWRWSRNTLSLLLSRGYLYDSSLMDSDDPYVIKHDERKLVVLPVDWRLDDWPYLELYRTLTPKELLSMWLEELEYARSRKGFVSITLHPQCIGRGARIKILEELITVAIKMKAWIPKGIDMARYVLGIAQEDSILIREL